MKGYKATDKDMKCRNFQFELGKWYDHEGPLVECQSGFHFCEQPSGPWAYYSAEGTRIFEIEADDVQEVPFQPGANFKRVCRRIKLVKEIVPDGYGNTGNENTGDRNTGDRNTGNGNTGYGNTGNENTGDWNTGYRNTGDWNTGDRNTGDGNTGNWNTGYRNTGNGNTGYGNTGYGNTTDFSSGFFCLKEPKVISFDVQTNLTRVQFLNRYPESYALGEALLGAEAIDFAPYSKIPGITPSKLQKLHDKFIKAREQETSK